MRIFSAKKISSLLGAGTILLLTLTFGLTSTASADCIYQYNANGFATSTTPVFNQICGAPEGIGDEANFVRIRADVNGNDEDNTNNPAYSIGTINSACTTGEKFDIWNYVHNNASPNNNPDVGNGSAVALGTYLNMTAPIGTASNSFSFTATVGDSGNLTGTAGPTSTTNMTPAVLDCGSNKVELSLVPGSVNIYSIPYGAWENLPQNAAALNTNLPIGSTNAGLSSLGSGSEWGCWNYRIVVVYQVEVTPVPPVQTPATCNLLTLENDNGVAKVDVDYTANDSTVNGINLLINGTTTQLTPNQLPYTFTMTPGTTYNVSANIVYTLGSVTSAVGSSNCSGTITSATPTPPPTTPPAAPTTLVNTGPGSVVAIFVGATAAGTAFYNWFLKKRLAKQ